MEVTYNAARRFRSAVGYSRAPTPTAAVPLRGKKPCMPMIASGEEFSKPSTKEPATGRSKSSPVRTPHAGCQSSS